MNDTARVIGRPGVYPEALERSGVSDRAFRLWCRLSRYAQMPHGAVPKRQGLADELGCSLSALDRARRELEAAGWLSALQRVRVAGPDGRVFRYTDEVRPGDQVLGQTSNEYLVFFEQQPTAAERDASPDAGATDEAYPGGDPLVTGDYPPSSPVTTRSGSGSGSGSLDPLYLPSACYVESSPTLPELAAAQRSALGAFMTAAADAGLAARHSAVPSGTEPELAVRDGATAADAAYAVNEAVTRGATLAYAVGVFRRLGRDRAAGRNPYPQPVAPRRGRAPAVGTQPEYFRPPPPRPPAPRDMPLRPPMFDRPAR